MKQSAVQAPYEQVEVGQTPETAETKPNRRVLSKQRTRQKVLASARALFIERGYETSTVRDIARKAGMSTGAVFANFADKSDLFEAIIMEDFDQVAEAMRAAAAANRGPIEARLLDILSAGYGYYADSLPLGQAILAQSWLRPLNAELRARAALKVLLGIIGDVLREAARTSEIRQDFDVRLVSEMLWSAYLGNYRRAIYDGWNLETLRARLADQIGIVLGGLIVR
jgi:AcrR family transcriptional regulator